MAATDGRPPQRDADRFLAAMQTIMSLPPEKAGAIRARRLTSQEATTRAKDKRAPAEEASA